MDSSFAPHNPTLAKNKSEVGQTSYLCIKKTLVTTLQREISHDLQMQHTLFSLA
jgi:hypothetical protein